MDVVIDGVRYVAAPEFSAGMVAKGAQALSEVWSWDRVAGNESLREFMARLLANLWRHGRIVDYDSDWQQRVAGRLAKLGYVPGQQRADVEDEDGTLLWRADEPEGREFVEMLFRVALGLPVTPAAESPPQGRRT